MSVKRASASIKCSGDFEFDSMYRRWLQKQEEHSRAIFAREPYYLTYARKVKEMQNGEQ